MHLVVYLLYCCIASAVGGHSGLQYDDPSYIHRVRFYVYFYFLGFSHLGGSTPVHDTPRRVCSSYVSLGRACVCQPVVTRTHAHTHRRQERASAGKKKKKKGQDDTHGKLCRRHGTHGLPWTIPYHSVFFYISLSSHAISSNPNPVQQVGFTTRNRHDTENQNTGNQSFPPPPPSYHLI